LYPTLSTKTSGAEVKLMMDLITWSDGTRSLIDIAEICKAPVWDLYPIIEILSKHQLIVLLDAPKPN
jgi:aminopeptidase-like protein